MRSRIIMVGIFDGFQIVTCNTPECPLHCHTGTCKVVKNVPKCQCPNEFQGEFCQHYRCSGHCLNQGICRLESLLGQDHSDGSLPKLICECPLQWTGERCEISASKCLTFCHNGARCTSNGECLCPSGFKGDTCQECDDLMCENNGTCMRNEAGHSHCKCSKEYTGVRCEKGVCEGYCNDHGECTVHLDLVKCKCDKGFFGRQCELEVCTGYCLNGGSCTIDFNRTKTCQCPGNFRGPRCNLNGEDLCADITCQNGGVCKTAPNRAYCKCTGDWTGEYCQESQHSSIDDDSICVNYCLNGGVCQMDDHHTAACHCVNEWSGDRCEYPPDCTDRCGGCLEGSTINQCR